MKKFIYLILSLAAALILTVTCKEKETSPDEIAKVLKETPTFYATINSNEDDAVTKTFLNDECKLRWNSNDEISVFDGNIGNKKYVFSGEDGASSGALTYQSGTSSSTYLDNIYAIYPYNASNTILANGNITINYPREQSYANGSFGPGTNIMMAVSELGDYTLHFNNVCGFLRLSLTGSKTITAIRLKGNNNEKLSGEMTITANSEGDPFTITMAEDASKEIVLNLGDEGVILTSTPSLFYITLPPTSFDNGFTVEIMGNDGLYMTKTTSSSIAIESNHILPMKTIDYNPNAGAATTFISKSVLGAYGAGATDIMPYRKGYEQVITSCLLSSYKFIMVNNNQYMVIDGVPMDAIVGDEFEATVSRYNLEAITEGTRSMKVLRSSSSLLWLWDITSSPYVGYIIKNK